MVNINEYINQKYPDFFKRKEIKELDVGNQGIAGHFSLKNLGFTNLIYLNFAGNEIESMDTYELDNLLSLSISFNQISNLEILKPLTKLIYLHCSFNQLTSLDINNFPKLAFLNCSNNFISNLEPFIKGKLAYLCWNENGEEKTYIKFLEDKKLRMGVWEFHRDVEAQYGDRLAKGIMKIVDFSNLDNWVENYDVSKRGDSKYHEILGKEVGFTELNWSSLENLAIKFLARCLITQNRLVNGVNKEWEENINQESEREMRTYLMRPMNNNFLTDDIQKAVDKEVFKREKIENKNISLIDTFDYDWKNIHPDFGNIALIQQWQDCGFSYKETKEWVETGLKPVDVNYASWLRDIVNITAKELLNFGDDKILREQFLEYKLTELKSRIEVPSKNH